MSDTKEHWAREFVLTTELAHKVAPPVPPAVWADGAEPERIAAPGRPAELRVASKSKRSLRRGELRDPKKRARLLHTFWHHELQAAELLCWAILAFPEAPRAFRSGLIGIWRDEVRHMRMYAAHLESLGSPVGSFEVRDWFWTRVPTCRTPLQFVSLFGMGLEGGNLDHSARYVEWFEACGDMRAAEIQRVVGREEVAHVRFAVQWFREWAGEVGFERWREQLVDPLTPDLLRGRLLNRADRERAGLSAAFLDDLDAFAGR